MARSKINHPSTSSRSSSSDWISVKKAKSHQTLLAPPKLPKNPARSRSLTTHHPSPIRLQTDIRQYIKHDPSPLDSTAAVESIDAADARSGTSSSTPAMDPPSPSHPHEHYELIERPPRPHEIPNHPHRGDMFDNIAILPTASSGISEEDSDDIQSPLWMQRPSDGLPTLDECSIDDAWRLPSPPLLPSTQEMAVVGTLDFEI